MTLNPQQLPDWLEAMVPDVARALCVADGFNPDDEVIAGQAAAFENFGPRWQANERSEGTLGGRNYVTEARAALAEAAPKIVERMAQWQPIETAPRDRTHILAKLAKIEDERWDHLTGRCFAIFHEGKTSSGYDLGWALFPGFGGAPDHWIEGWMPLPIANAIRREVNQ